jgi:hypothetical protein
MERPKPSSVNYAHERVAPHVAQLQNEDRLRGNLGEQQPFQPIPEEQQATERLGKPPPGELPESLDLPQPQDAAELDRKERHRAYKREWQRQWYQQHPEEGRQRSREASRKYYQQNREWVLEQRRRWREQNRERLFERAAEKPSPTHREYQHEYYLKNRERIRERKRENYRRTQEAKGK